MLSDYAKSDSVRQAWRRGRQAVGSGEWEVGSGKWEGWRLRRVKLTMKGMKGHETWVAASTQGTGRGKRVKGGGFVDDCDFDCD